MSLEHTGKVSTVAFSSDGKILASGSENQRVALGCEHWALPSVLMGAP
jgi:WD40 repeat protein